MAPQASHRLQVALCRLTGTLYVKTKVKTIMCNASGGATAEFESARTLFL